MYRSLSMMGCRFATHVEWTAYVIANLHLSRAAWAREMTVKGRIWKAVIGSALCGTTVHFLFMYFRTRKRPVLPSFQPYQAFQAALSQWVGANVPGDCAMGAFVPERHYNFRIFVWAV